MTTQKREDVIRKVTAMLRLAENEAASAEEAQTAMAMAQQMMDKFEIEREEINLDPQQAEKDYSEEEEFRDFSEVNEGEIDSSGGNRRGKVIAQWKMNLARYLVKANGCFMFQSYRGTKYSIEIVGKPSNVQTVRYFYAWYSKEVESISKFWCRGLGMTWNQEFKIGMVEGLQERLEEMRKKTLEDLRYERKDNPNALMIVNKAIAKFEQRAQLAKEFAYSKHTFGRAKGSYSGGRIGSAREEGRAASGYINLNKSRGGIGGGSKGQLGQ